MRETGGITREEFRERIARCLAEMEQRQIDVMLVYGDSARPENLVYLTDYRPIGSDLPGNCGYNALFLLERDGTSTLVIDREWYLDWAREESWVTDILADDQGDTLSVAHGLLAQKKLLRARIEADVGPMPTDVYKRFLGIFAGCAIDETPRIVSWLRAVKSPSEIALISRGLEILGKAHDAGLALAREGVTEVDIALEMRRVIMEEGAEYPRAMFVDSGRRATIALASPMHTMRRLERGDMVLVSTFCTYRKYSPGLDRNWVVGEPSERQRTLAEIELKSLDRAVSLIRPGVRACDLMRPVYAEHVEPLLKAAGFREYNLQGYLGHGTGILTKETPFLWRMDTTAMRPGMVIHLEPGIYAKDPRIGGMRTADTIVVTADGCENITRYPRRVGTLASAQA